MKVLHIISGGDKGGAKTHVFNLLDKLNKNIDVNIVCLMDGVFYCEIKKMDIPVTLIKQKNRFDISVVDKIINLIKKENYEILHSHGARANFISYLIKKRYDIPVLSTVHSDYLKDFQDSIYRKLVFTTLNVFSLKRLDYFIGVSKDFKSMLLKRGFDSDTVYTVYNGIDFEKDITVTSKEQFLSDYEIKYDKNKKYIGIIGRHDKVKGHDVFIKSAIEISKKRNDIVFLLAGDGNEQTKLENMSKTFSNILFLGHVSDIYSFINLIDINVLTSHSESFPYVLLEGARLKKATISSNVGGISDLIEDNITGYLFEDNKVDDLTKKIEYLLDDSEKKNEFGENLYNKAKNQFSNESLYDKHIFIYNNILRNIRYDFKYSDVLLSGYYGFKNGGDDAILESMIRDLRKEKNDIKIRVLSKTPHETNKDYLVSSTYRFNIIKIFKEIKRTKIFVNGGGSLLQDVSSMRSIFYYLALNKLALIKNKKIMLYANGIGPIKRKISKVLIKRILNKVDLITLRDEISLNTLKELNIKKPDVKLTFDCAFSLEPEYTKNVEEIVNDINDTLANNKKRVLVSVREWKKSKRMDQNSFNSEMAIKLDYIINKYDVSIIFMPMRYASDLKIIEDIKNSMTNKSYIIKKQLKESEKMAIMGTCHLTIAMRLHALIYSARVCTPMVGISYDVKVDGLLKTISQPIGGSFNEIKTQKLVNAFDICYNDADNLKGNLQNNLAKFRELAYQNAKYLVEMLNDDK